MVDICELNKIAKDDCYLMLLQTNITLAVAGAKFITIINAMLFFYQFLVSEQNCNKFMVISHQSQEYFKVAVIEFKNSLVYIKKMINIIHYLF